MADQKNYPLEGNPESGKFHPDELAPYKEISPETFAIMQKAAPDAYANMSYSDFTSANQESYSNRERIANMTDKERNLMYLNQWYDRYKNEKGEIGDRTYKYIITGIDQETGEKIQRKKTDLEILYDSNIQEYERSSFHKTSPDGSSVRLVYDHNSKAYRAASGVDPETGQFIYVNETRVMIPQGSPYRSPGASDGSTGLPPNHPNYKEEPKQYIDEPVTQQQAASPSFTAPKVSASKTVLTRKAAPVEPLVRTVNADMLDYSAYTGRSAAIAKATLSRKALETYQARIAAQTAGMPITDISRR